MTEEVQVPAGAEPVPEQVATAAPGAEDTSPETPEQSQDKPAAKSFTQEEVDALIGDPSKATAALGWKAKTHWKELAQLMVDADIEALANKG
jgi:GDP-D-mannose dehydratase